MSGKSRFFFFVVLIAEIIAGELNFRLGVYILKPLILITLMYEVSMGETIYRGGFLAALFFSLLGDIFLMLEIESLFLIGLVCFLVTHLFYIWIFSKKANARLAIVLPFGLVVGAFYWVVIHPNVPNTLIIPIVVYMLIITVMGITLNSLATTHKAAQWMIAIGAVLFILSDSLIAVNKFVVVLPYPTLLIMATYGAAQFLITSGYIQLFSKKNSDNSSS